jgi:aspartate/methionine/tyrosine aminotransferase
MTDFQPFVQERVMSKFEQDVEYNLADSGVHPLLLRELLASDTDFINTLMDTDLNYAHANGIPELRKNIAALYSGATEDNILVTVGAIEANYLTIRTLLSPEDEIVIMLPNYMQIWGVAKNHELNIKTFNLKEENGWAPDLSELNEAITPQTKLIAVCNPNNPTGYILTDDEMRAIVSAADSVGAWILADEVYIGAERITSDETKSFYGMYNKVIATGSMSKAYGLPGLRLGWAVGPVPTIDDIWARHEYITISATMLSNKLSSRALSPQVRPQLIQRTRDYIKNGYPVLQEWIDNHGDTFSIIPPAAAAIAFIRYHLDINSSELTERLVKEKSVLIVPGDHFGMDKFLRVSFGLPPDYLRSGLDRIHQLILEING